MELLDNFSDPFLARKLLDKVASYNKEVSFMEVCGTHTVAIFKTGLRSGLPDNINLVSGPGCPVCVTPLNDIEKAIGLACRNNTVLFCFGDMMRVPGVTGSLETARAEKSAQVKIIYSPIEALDYAKKNPDQDVVLFGVGFETTVPLFASVMLRAHQENLTNIYLFSAFKLVPPAIDALLASGEVNLNGFLLPGHVSAIIGADAYQFMVEKHNTSGVIAGFEVVDILTGIDCLLDIVENKEIAIKNQYHRVVSAQGNRRALDIIYKVFIESEATWRGVGEIPQSGLSLHADFAEFDAEQLIDFSVDEVSEPKGCRCGDVIKGLSKPADCPLYKTKCTPSNPVGPCMVSSEGTCAAYYKYGE
jgi:hydrogenase expression/formation protein HypD